MSEGLHLTTSRLATFVVYARILKQDGTCVSLEVSKTRVEVIVAALKERLRARVALQRQLDALVKVKVLSIGSIHLSCLLWFRKHAQLMSTSLVHAEPA